MVVGTVPGPGRHGHDDPHEDPPEPDTSMSTASARPRPDSPPDERFTLRDRAQVLATLGKLAADEVPVTCSYGPEGDVLHSKVLGVSDDRRTIFLELSGDEAADAAFVSSGPVSCQAALANIRIEFVIEPVMGRRFYSKAFAAPLPPFLVRVQRREYYRMNMSGVTGLACELAMPRADRTDPMVGVTVLDLSGGGMAVRVPPGPWALRLHVELRACRVTLGDMGELEARAVVRNLVKLADDEGKPYVRMGCEFAGLRDGEISLLQRFVSHAQRLAREQAQAQAQS